MQYYTYGIRFENMASHDVHFKWNENNIQRKHYVKPLSSSVYYGVVAYSKDNQNPTLRIEALNPANGERVMLSNQEFVSFPLSTYERRVRTVFVEPTCK